MAGVRAKPHIHRFPGDLRDKGDIRDSIKLSGGKGLSSLSLFFCLCSFPGDCQGTRGSGLRQRKARQCLSWEGLKHGRSLQAFEDMVHVELASLGIGLRLLFPHQKNP